MLSTENLRQSFLQDFSIQVFADDNNHSFRRLWRHVTRFWRRSFVRIVGIADSLVRKRKF